MCHSFREAVLPSGSLPGTGAHAKAGVSESAGESNRKVAILPFSADATGNVVQVALAWPLQRLHVGTLLLPTIHTSLSMRVGGRG